MRQYLNNLILNKIKNSKNYRDIIDFLGNGVYLRRHYLLFKDRKNKDEIPSDTLFNVFGHEILKSDVDPFLHNHPWPYFTYIVSGGYWEHLPGNKRIWRGPGYYTYRKANSFHKLELNKDENELEIPCVTLFIRGRRTQDWGFDVNGKIIQWEEYLNNKEKYLNG